MTVTHTIPNPFPVSTHAFIILDEVCWCGRGRHEHEDTMLYGHGPCPETGCDRFRFKHRVTEHLPKKWARRKK